MSPKRCSCGQTPVAHAEYDLRIIAGTAFLRGSFYYSCECGRRTRLLENLESAEREWNKMVDRAMAQDFSWEQDGRKATLISAALALGIAVILWISYSISRPLTLVLAIALLVVLYNTGYERISTVVGLDDRTAKLLVYGSETLMILIILSCVAG